MQVVVLAAGMGSRFGGLKQMEKIDEWGNFIIDYSVFDAIRAGFDEVIFVIKKEHLEAFEETIGNRLKNHATVKYAFQDINDLPEGFSVPVGRIKPWGTGQALLAAKDLINGPFIIINGDDFYGKETYEKAAGFIKTLDKKSTGKYANIAFEVQNTLAENGAVKRGVCFMDENKNLTRMIESQVELNGDLIDVVPLDSKIAPFKTEKGTLVSMNLFCFTKDFISHLENGWIDFLKAHGNDLKSEYLIPDFASKLVEEKVATIKIETSPAVWYGITYREDTPKVVNAIKEMKKQGIYSEKLYK